jgi:hypothetical protein
MVLGALTLGPFMHETDQGWLLDGGLAITQGHLGAAEADFNFDKQFVSYLLSAAVLAMLPHPPDADTAVLAGNVFAMFFFWGAFLWLLVRSAHRLSFAAALTVLLTPAFLVHSPYYASAFVSAALVLILAVWLDRKKWSWPAHGVVFGLAFGVVGARADGLLLLPLLAMLHSPQRTLKSVLQAPNTWLMASAGLAAFFVGRHLYEAPIVDYFPLPFRLKQFLACVAFGLGGTGLLLLASLQAISRTGWMNRCRVWPALLALALALPMAYYCLQLLSPRHCVDGALAVVVFICSRPGRTIFQVCFRRRIWTRVVSSACLIAAVAPVFLGLNLADIRHPRLTFAHPTLLPSAAGVFPVGAYLGNAVNVRWQHGFMDHNQAIWSAARTVDYAPGTDGQVPIIATPVESYLFFAIRLRGQTPHHYALEHLPPRFYVDSRSLMRFAFVWPPDRLSMEQFFASVNLTPATSANWHGITILQGQSGGALDNGSWSAPLWALNEAFGGDEFHLDSTAALAKIPDGWEGNKLVLASRGDFGVTGVRTSEISSPLLGNWRICEINPLHRGDDLRVQTNSPDAIWAAPGAFPAWLSLRKF